MRWTFGSGLGFKMAEPAIRTAMRTGWQISCGSTPHRNAATKRRARNPFAAWMENGLVRWNQGASWYEQAENELLKFPAGKNG